MQRLLSILIVLILFFLCSPMQIQASELFSMPEKTVSRWASFENPLAEKGKGGLTNKGGKGAAFAPVAPGETKVLMDAQGSGTLRRMWVTLRNREPQDLRSYVLRMYWDGAEKPAVEAPFGDFFGHILGEMTTFENELFSSPEGRSFNCVIPMPFRSAAKVTFTNESDTPLDQLFYDINYTLNEDHDEDMLYFHATWRRERWTELGKDFAILPAIAGKGRFLGAHIGVIGHPENQGWWGEGEVKVYLDGDAQSPTLVGTGTEDYIGTAYGQGVFANRYQGCLVLDEARRHYTFYRYHIPDPVYFHQDIRVTIQQMGGSGKQTVIKLLEKGVAIQPVTIHDNKKMHFLLDGEAPVDILKEKNLPEGWTNMYRRDDVCALALFYFDKRENPLPPLAGVEDRVVGLED